MKKHDEHKRITRRRFLKGSLLGGAFLFLSSFFRFGKDKDKPNLSNKEGRFYNKLAG